ncbi:MAG: putative PEP-binding protein [Nanoarchaeota archaeon]|nr:putative PEP-binding protein [Nanoarchaeota archaeon]
MIYRFNAEVVDGSDAPEMIALLGNKGAKLHAMTLFGLPVPPGFTIPISLGEQYFRSGNVFPDGLENAVCAGMRELEDIHSLRFGDTVARPLLVSVRSGAAASMPGMMETVLNVGLTEKSVAAYRASNPQESWFILDCYRRLQEMFGKNVYDIPDEAFYAVAQRVVGDKNPHIIQFTDGQLQDLVQGYNEVYVDHGISQLPQDPYVQLFAAIEAVEKSIMGKKARDFRRVEGLPAEMFTAVNVQTMVYGNRNKENCGTLVCFTRDGNTGKKDTGYGEFLLGGQGEDVVNGRNDTSSLRSMQERLPHVYQELIDYFPILEGSKKRVQDIEATIDSGKLWMLQTRDAKLKGLANIRANLDMVKEGIIDDAEFLRRVKPKDVELWLQTQIDYRKLRETHKLEDIIINKMGIDASHGAGVGKLVFDVDTAQEYHARGEPLVLCRWDTNPADFPGMVLAEALFTSRGGQTSHAAVVARGKGIPCVTGTNVEVDYEKKELQYKDKEGRLQVVREGEYVSVDGSAAKVLRVQAPVTDAAYDVQDMQDFLRLVKPHAHMRVLANANDAEEAKVALAFGAEGIGLARTEYMFLDDKIPGERRAVTIQSWVLANDVRLKAEALQRLEDMQKRDFLGMYEVMGVLPIIIRLLDYPLHELLGDVKSNLESLVLTTGLSEEQIGKNIAQYKEHNPMLGHRSVRLGITHPELFAMQGRAIFAAAREYNLTHDNQVVPYIEIPLVINRNEVVDVAKVLDREAPKYGFSRYGSSKAGGQYKLGIMFETAAACLEADKLARTADFGSFGTNDLTQTVLGWSREDGNETFAPVYIAKKIVAADPFAVIDKDGPVAKLMQVAVAGARRVKSDFEFGICGSHGSNPESLEVCYALGLDNVSPVPNQVPLAWLKSAQLSLEGKRIVQKV